MSTDILQFDVKNLNLVIDAEQEDDRLHQELEQLIAEQFNDFDLGDNVDDGLGSRSIDSCRGEESCLDDVSTLLTGENLSLLEKAIKEFGEGNLLSSGAIKVSSINAEDNSGPDLYTLHDGVLLPAEQVETSCQISVVGEANTHNVYDEGERLQSDLSSFVGGLKQMVKEPGNTRSMNTQNFSFKTGDDLTIPQPNRTYIPTMGSMLPHNASPYSRPRTAMAVSTHSYYTTTPVIPTALSNPIRLTMDQRQHGHLPPTKGGSPPEIFNSKSSPRSNHTNRLDEGNANLSPVKHSPDSTPPKSLRLPSTHVTDDRLDVLYTARGRQLIELNARLDELQEEAAREKRIANHRLTLSDGEKQALAAKLASTEAALKQVEQKSDEHLQNVQLLHQRLSEMDNMNNQLNNELITLRATNESLSTQLVEVTTGDAARRAEEREDRLTEALERRYALASEEVKAELQRANKRLCDKECELIDLQRQLEIQRADANKARSEFNESLSRANKQLEEAQQHCQKLASSALCSEVTSLRLKVGELETSNKVTEDVNKILQDELHDLRDQVALYESALQLDQIIRTRSDSASALNDPNQPSPILTGRRPKSVEHTVTFAENAEQAIYNPVPRPSSSLDNFGGDDASTPFTSKQRKTKLLSSNVDGDAETDMFRSLNKHAVPTSTPAPSSLLTRLQTELACALSHYRCKREQVTQLHEVIFTTRCQLHQASENSKRLEKSNQGLQDRVLTLERELSSVHELTSTPGHREHLLHGQLERLKADYTNLEEELQSSRSRLQAALGAEARALENEKAASERLAASSAERDAAVDRARAVCEAHYTTMRRRLEVDWANEREAATRRNEELLNRLRQERSDVENELQHVTQLLQEAQLATQHAVNNALNEAMQEREAERIRFWREELPTELSKARSFWEKEWHMKHTIAMVDSRTSTVDESVKHIHTISCDTQTNSIFTASVAVDTQAKGNSVSESMQTDIMWILSMHGLTDKLPTYPPYPSLSSKDFHQLRILPYILCQKSLLCLRLQMIASPLLSLDTLDECLCSFLAERAMIWQQHTWAVVNKGLDQLLSHHDLDSLLPPAKIGSILPTERGWFDEPGNSLRSPTSPISAAIHDSPDSADQIDRSVIRNTVQFRLYSLVKLLSKFRTDLRTTQTKLEAAEKHTESSQQAYQHAMEHIKQDVMTYVQSCQNRATETMEYELTRVHQDACRLFTKKLRQCVLNKNQPDYEFSSAAATPHVCNTPPITQRPSLTAISETGCSVSSGMVCHPVDSRTMSPEDIPRARRCSFGNRVGEPKDLESLLRIIDQVCASTESAFSDNQHTPIFDIFTGTKVGPPSSQNLTPPMACPLPDTAVRYPFAHVHSSSNENGHNQDPICPVATQDCALVNNPAIPDPRSAPELESKTSAVKPQPRCRKSTPHRDELSPQKLIQTDSYMLINQPGRTTPKRVNKQLFNLLENLSLKKK